MLTGRSRPSAALQSLLPLPFPGQPLLLSLLPELLPLGKFRLEGLQGCDVKPEGISVFLPPCILLGLNGRQTGGFFSVQLGFFCRRCGFRLGPLPFPLLLSAPAQALRFFLVGLLLRLHLLDRLGVIVQLGPLGIFLGLFLPEGKLLHDR